MNIKTYIAALTLAAFTAAGAFAAPELTAGKYQARISPTVDSQTAKNIKKGLDAVQQINSIKVDEKESTLSFAVKDGESVDLAQLQDAVKAAAPDARLSSPQMQETGSKSTSGASGSNRASGAMKSSSKNTGSNSNY